MPANDDAMNDPITRREFHERLASFETGLRSEMAQLSTELRGEMTELRTELRGEMAGLRTELRGAMAELRTELRTEMEHLRITLQADAQATLKALNEKNRAWFLTIDDKYKDLPDRVRKLEEAVFSPPPRTRRRKAS